MKRNMLGLAGASLFVAGALTGMVAEPNEAEAAWPYEAAFTEAEQTAMEWCVDTAETEAEQSHQGIVGCYTSMLPIAAERGE
jgi:hypothetical protein